MNCSLFVCVCLLVLFVRCCFLWGGGGSSFFGMCVYVCGFLFCLFVVVLGLFLCILWRIFS